jgi:hypothetical protein
LGAATELTRNNNWMGAILEPDVEKALEPSSSESDAMLAGRVVGDLLTVVIGVVEVSGGVGIAGGGAVVGCGTTLCLAAVPAVAAGVAVVGVGTMTTAAASVALGENLRKLSKNSISNQGKTPEFPNSPNGSKGPYQSPNGFPSDPAKPPASGFDWKGKGEPGTNKGSWYNLKTNESYHWDPYHHNMTHYDYTSPLGNGYRIWPDGSMTPK